MRRVRRRAANGDYSNYERHEKSHRWPQFLPGGRAVLFNIVSADITQYDDAKIAVLSLDTGQIRVMLDGGTHPQFVRTGHLLYVRGGSLVAVPFDPRRLEVAGESVAVLDDVSTTTVDGTAHFSVSESGLLAYLRGAARGSDRSVVWVDRRGHVDTLMDASPVQGVQLSPDGQRLALSIPAANDQAWIYDVARRRSLGCRSPGTTTLIRGRPTANRLYSGRPGLRTGTSMRRWRTAAVPRSG